MSKKNEVGVFLNPHFVFFLTLTAFLTAPNQKMDTELPLKSLTMSKLTVSFVSGHSSWSTEKAVVTGIQAIAHLSSDYGLICGNHDIIPAATDTEPLSSLQKVAKNLRAVVPPPGDGIPVSPLARLLKF